MRSSQIRQKFIDFFKSKQHQPVPSSSLVPQNDPTLLFTNAGMNQFKDVFLGKENRSYRRAVTVQKCVRAGGKHNDLENVGYTARHHTFFEMLGNFSFGDYFKSEAISYAWEFTTKVLGLSPHQLHVTVHETDHEAEKIWHEQEKVPLDRIHRMGDKDNFWQMGETGPCGPCSELFVDRGEKYCQKKGQNDPSCKVGCDCDRYLEFWNLVFMQYDRSESGKLTPLPKPSVDTGAGLERISMILQNVDTNYDTDQFVNIITRSQQLLKSPSKAKDENPIASWRVIADHARAATFLVADGVLPGPEGRQYVLRRILRRAVRHGQLLGFDRPFLFEVCRFVIEEMKDAYPEIQAHQSLIERCVRAEEEQFLRTLATGLELLEAQAEKTKDGVLKGDVVFKLYDTYGFPVDLTKLICQERGLGIDEKGFEAAMAEQKSRSREHWKGSGDQAVGADYHKIAETLRQSGRTQEFVGYLDLKIQSECWSVITTQERDLVEAVFAKTPFYGESGGQVGDRGEVRGDDGFAGIVEDVQKPLPDLIVAKIRVKSGTLKQGDSYHQIVDKELRELTAKNHSATHLLHAALRKILGTHVKQSGSLVTPQMLRFDFSHFQALSAEELKQIEDQVNDWVWNDLPVTIENMDKDQAVASGAVAMFGEKYGDIVRVIKMGEASVELCGGTHVNRTSAINLFKLRSEAGIAAGVRRIIASTSKYAFEMLRERYDESQNVRDRFKAKSSEELMARFDKTLATEKDLRREIELFKSRERSGVTDQIHAAAKKMAGIDFVVHEMDHGSVNEMRELAENLKQKSPQTFVVLGMEQKDVGKVFVLAAGGKEAVKVVDAHLLIRDIAPLIEGRGGGKPEMAQAGGSRIGALSKVFSAAEAFVAAKVGSNLDGKSI